MTLNSCRQSEIRVQMFCSVESTSTFKTAKQKKVSETYRIKTIRIYSITRQNGQSQFNSLCGHMIFIRPTKSETDYLTRKMVQAQLSASLDHQYIPISGITIQQFIWDSMPYIQQPTYSLLPTTTFRVYNRQYTSYTAPIWSISHRTGHTSLG